MVTKPSKKLKDIACFNCDKTSDCNEKVGRSMKLLDVCDYMISKQDYKDCPIYISLIAPDMEDMS